jgi:hypothetical protein
MAVGFLELSERRAFFSGIDAGGIDRAPYSFAFLSVSMEPS